MKPAVLQHPSIHPVACVIKFLLVLRVNGAAPSGAVEHRSRLDTAHPVHAVGPSHTARIVTRRPVAHIGQLLHGLKQPDLLIETLIGEPQELLAGQQGGLHLALRRDVLPIAQVISRSADFNTGGIEEQSQFLAIGARVRHIKIAQAARLARGFDRCIALGSIGPHAELDRGAPYHGLPGQAGQERPLLVHIDIHAIVHPAQSNGCRAFVEHDRELLLGTHRHDPAFIHTCAVPKLHGHPPRCQLKSQAVERLARQVALAQQAQGPQHATSQRYFTQTRRNMCSIQAWKNTEKIMAYGGCTGPTEQGFGHGVHRDQRQRAIVTQRQFKIPDQGARCASHGLQTALRLQQLGLQAPHFIKSIR